MDFRWRRHSLLHAEGERLGRILVPETVANLTFGGFGKSRMFICATSSVYAIETARTGAQWP